MYIGADDFLPVLIWVVIKAAPPQLASNLEYIQRFRMASRFTAEFAYFYTQLVRFDTRNSDHLVMRESAASISVIAGQQRVQLSTLSASHGLLLHCAASAVTPSQRDPLSAAFALLVLQCTEGLNMADARYGSAWQQSAARTQHDCVECWLRALT